MLDVCLLGTSGMMPLLHRWLTSMMVRYNGSNLLVDCGEATQLAIRQVGWSPYGIDTICFTHYHADHISGLPGLLLGMGNAGRTEPLLMIGPKGLARVVNSLRVIAPELPFSIVFHELHGNETIRTHGYEIHAFRVHHNVPCYGYTIEIRRAGKFDVEAAKKRGIPVRYWNELQKGSVATAEDGSVYTPDMVMGPERKGLKVTYCTDTRPTDGIVEAARDADLFICEGMYGDRSKAANAKKNKHMLFSEAAEMGRRANVRELWLTHFSPSMVDGERYMKDVRKICPQARLGKDGLIKELCFEDE